MQCSVPFVQQSLCLLQWDNGLQRWVHNSCTVRFGYRIFEYLFVLEIFDLLGFRSPRGFLQSTMQPDQSTEMTGPLIWCCPYLFHAFWLWNVHWNMHKLIIVMSLVSDLLWHWMVRHTNCIHEGLHWVLYCFLSVTHTRSYGVAVVSLPHSAIA